MTDQDNSTPLPPTRPPDETLTPEQIAQCYKAIGDSVWFINAVISGEADGDKIAVERNVSHLEYMLTKPYWTTEDMTAVNEAIVAGKAYVG